jgi:hypothetical protein
VRKSALFVALLVVACGGSSSEKALRELLPASGEITGWVEDTSRGEAGPEETSELTVAYDWVDGAMDKFKLHGWEALAREYYKNSDMKLTLYIYRMSSTQNAEAVYQAIADYSGVEWTDTQFGGGESKGRFGVIYTYCYADAVKGKYFLESSATPGSAETAAKDFFRAALKKIP